VRVIDKHLSELKSLQYLLCVFLCLNDYFYYEIVSLSLYMCVFHFMLLWDIFVFLFLIYFWGLERKREGWGCRYTVPRVSISQTNQN
jgi:hypothetical protein